MAKSMRGQKLNFLNTWKRNPNSVEAIADAAREAAKTADDLAAEQATEAQRFVNTLKAVSEERPEFFDPLRLAYEFSDGDINTMGKLNLYIKESLPAIQKQCTTKHPDIPNAIVQGLYSNYCSILTSTPMKALFGNVGGMIAKPLPTLVVQFLEVICVKLNVVLLPTLVSLIPLPKALSTWVRCLPWRLRIRTA